MVQAYQRAERAQLRHNNKYAIREYGHGKVGRHAIHLLRSP